MLPVSLQALGVLVAGKLVCRVSGWQVGGETVPLPSSVSTTPRENAVLNILGSPRAPGHPTWLRKKSLRVISPGLGS